MSKKGKNSQKPRKLPKPNPQIPISAIQPLQAVGLNPMVLRAREFPFHGCWAMKGWQEMGMTPVIVARMQDDGRILFGNYLVDTFCLGVKDAFTRADISLNRFERDLPEMCQGNPQRISVELAHEIIYGALEFAEESGFQPHPDFFKEKGDLVLDPPEAHPRVDHVQFGKAGRPVYIPGPYDTALKMRQVITTLTRTRGPGNFDALQILGDAPEDLAKIEYYPDDLS